jgi:hypothetical protein
MQSLFFLISVLGVSAWFSIEWKGKNTGSLYGIIGK